VVSTLTRIVSDLHFGDRSSRVDALGQLQPLVDGADEFIFNGDTLDTRPGPRPQHTAECRAATHAFANENTAVRFTFLTGNHDPDFSGRHTVELAGQRVLVTHGDIVFDDIVPWGRDAPLIRKRIGAELGRLGSAAREDLAERFAIWRRVAATIPQRHQSEPHRLKYALRYAADTVWPPLRVFRILRAWRMHASCMAELARRHFPAAKIIVIGHTHRPGLARLPDGRTVINTGSFCPPLGGFAVDVGPAAVRVRRVEFRAGEFRLSENIAELAL